MAAGAFGVRLALSTSARAIDRDGLEGLTGLSATVSGQIEDSPHTSLTAIAAIGIILYI